MDDSVPSGARWDGAAWRALPGCGFGFSLLDHNGDHWGSQEFVGCCRDCCKRKDEGSDTERVSARWIFTRICLGVPTRAGVEKRSETGGAAEGEDAGIPSTVAEIVSAEARCIDFEQAGSSFCRIDRS